MPTYGRRKGDNKVLCNGEMDDFELDTSDCLQTDLIEQTWQKCRGKSSCGEIVPLPTGLTWPAGECQDTAQGPKPRKNEMNVTFLCVDCSQYWADWAGFNLVSDNRDCLPRALLALNWATSEEVVVKSEADQKDLLVEGLSSALNPEYHSMPDLSQRSLTGEQGSLCGLAALYSSLVNTLLTKAQLRAYDIESMREFIQNILTDYPWPFDADQQKQHENIGKMNQLADANLLNLFYIGKK